MKNIKKVEIMWVYFLTFFSMLRKQTEKQFTDKLEIESVYVSSFSRDKKDFSEKS